MPIRFRCVYCDQLLGIARRKAGTVVKCPKCAGQLIVPTPEGMEPVAPVMLDGGTEKGTSREPPAGGNGPGVMFERSDFDELLRPAAAPGGTATASPKIVPAPASPFDMQTIGDDDKVVASPRAATITPAVQPTALPRGILLTPLRATILIVVVGLGLAASFGAGLLVGKSMQSRANATQPLP